MVELQWEGKYDAQGKKTAPLRLRLPFQTVETINESAQQRQKALDFDSTGRDPAWRNKLIWGDKKYVLSSLLDEFAGEFDLIYVDPPFATGDDFSFSVKLNGEEFTKEASVIEQKAYRDTWGKGLDSYLQWFYEAVVLLRDLLSEHGSIYVHLDWHVGHYAKVVLDEVFSSDRLANEIVWHYRTFQGQTHKYFARKHDTLFLYTKSAKFTYNEQFDTALEDTIDAKRWERYITEEGHILGSKMPTQDSRFRRYLNKWKKKHGRDPGPDDVVFVVRGQPIDSVWDMKGLDPKSKEKVGYPTQKPESLLERIVRASSNEGDLVLDCFCGSGTTPVVAGKLGRRWIAADLGRFAIQTTRKRLLSVENVKPFVIQNLGKYERQAWQAAEFGGSEQAASVIRSYRCFILQLYNARPIDGYAWLHGLKNGRMVHVGSVDAPVSPGDVQKIALEFRKAVGHGKDSPSVNAVDVLGWDFAFELNEVAKQQAAKANIEMRFLRIPREVLEKRAVEQGGIAFFELAALSVSVRQKQRAATVELTDFIIPPDDVPADVQAAITHWSQWIDYWSVDWDFKRDTFHNMWQSYRTRENKTLELKASHAYEKPGSYMILVKVIDILGNDTTKSIRVDVS